VFTENKKKVLWHFIFTAETWHCSQTHD